MCLARTYLDGGAGTLLSCAALQLSPEKDFEKVFNASSTIEAGSTISLAHEEDASLFLFKLYISSLRMMMRAIFEV